MLRLRLDGAQGLHLKLSNRPDIVARLSRGDVNMPSFDGAPIDTQVPEDMFEVAIDRLLRLEPDILASRLVYYCIPVQRVSLDIPQDIAGRHLFLFERTEGEKDVWWDLSPEQQVRNYFSNPFCSIQFNFANLL